MAKNRTMAAKNLKNRKLMQKEAREKYLCKVGHRFYLDELPTTSSWFFKVNATQHSKMWWEV